MPDKKPMQFTQEEMYILWRGVHARRDDLQIMLQEIQPLSDSASSTMVKRLESKLAEIQKLIERMQTEYFRP